VLNGKGREPMVVTEPTAHLKVKMQKERGKKTEKSL
jgi:hypothetical protein